MKKTILLLAGIICLCGILFGCGSSRNMTDTNDDMTIQNSISVAEENTSADNTFDAESESQTENSNISSADESPDISEKSDLLAELSDKFGISVLMPKNKNWIADEEYCLEDDNNLKITYHDLIAETEGTLLASKNNSLSLPQIEYDKSLDENWEGATSSGQLILIKVQRESNNGKMALATWKYNDCQFAIFGEYKKDYQVLPKVAIGVIQYLE